MSCASNDTLTRRNSSPDCNQVHRLAMQFDPIRFRSRWKLGQWRRGVSRRREVQFGGTPLRMDKRESDRGKIQPTQENGNVKVLYT
jgi:hypothetical protein